MSANVRLLLCRSEVDVECLPLSLAMLFTEGEALTEPKVGFG